MTTQDTDNARSQAKAQLDSIIEMLDRLHHVSECKGDADDCEADPELWGPESDFYNIDNYHDEDDARERIQEDALSVEVRSGWHSPGEQSEDEEYNILLCTGGPAVRIIGELNEHGEPTSARLQYQDWFTPWEEYVTTGADHAALIEFAGFYLGY